MIGWITLIAVVVFGSLTLLILVNGTERPRNSNRYQPPMKIDPPPR